MTRNAKSWDDFCEVEYGMITCPRCLRLVDFIYWAGDQEDYLLSKERELQSHARMHKEQEKMEDEQYLLDLLDLEEVPEDRDRMPYRLARSNRVLGQKNERPFSFRYA